MKKSLYILAALAIAACTKTQTNLDTTSNGELAVVPVARNITKAAITDGLYPEENHLALFAYHAPGVPANNASENPSTDYSQFVETYLYNTEYHCRKADINSKIWSGFQSSYYWPITGSLVFAGYSLPAPAAEGEASEAIGTVEYTLSTDKLKIDGYTQSVDPASTFDLLYFGRTDRSYNNRRTGEAIPLTFKHALSWITVEVKGGTGALIPNHVWSVTDVKLAGVQTTGTFTYTGTAQENTPKVVWVPTDQKSDFVIYSSDFEDKDGNKVGARPLTSAMALIENVTDGTLLIPQGAKTLWVTIQYTSPAGDTITENIDIDLATYTADGWEAGKKYTYQLTFDPLEIKVAPKVESWPDPINTTWPNN